jgi:hypothetical protein
MRPLVAPKDATARGRGAACKVGILHVQAGVFISQAVSKCIFASFSQLSSTKEGANDTLYVVEHTGGALKWGRVDTPKTSSLSSTLTPLDHVDSGDVDGPMGWVRDDEDGARFDVKTENKVYSFVPSQGFARRVERLEGWDSKGGLCSTGETRAASSVLPGGTSELPEHSATLSSFV